MSDSKDTPAATPRPDPNQPEEAVVVERRRPWLPVLIATLLAAIILVVLLIPGVLIYPEEDTTADDRQRMITLQEESNKALEERIAGLRALVQDDEVCVAEDGFFRRDEDGKLAPFGPAEEALLPRAAGRQPLAEEEVPEGVAFEGNLVELLDLATVMVLAPQAKAQGTGFFVAPGLIVTNRHVIGADSKTPLIVLGKGLDRPIPASLVAETGSSDFFTPDYALLKIEGADDLPYLAMTDKAKKLQEVVAAGFPGLLNETDEDIQRLASGDMQSMPEPSVTTGVITAQQAPRGADVLVHTATISGGSSGGPLVDECGRVVGMNTFVRSRKQDGGRLNYALATPSLVAFLKQQNVDAKVSTETCAPKPLVTAKEAPEEIKKSEENTETEEKKDPDAKPESKSE
ncbi:MAG: serine protease [Kiloniellales bacterium]